LSACTDTNDQVTSKTNSNKVVKEEKAPKILLDQLSNETHKDIVQITMQDFRLIFSI